MGYVTYFNLNKIQGSDEDYDALVKDIKEKTGYDFSEGEGVEAKWYDADKDMKTLTAKYPDLIVQLDGDGEDSEDLWQVRYRGGECECTRYEFQPFCDIASRQERVSFLARTYADARKGFIKLIGCIVGEQPLRETATLIVLQDDGMSVTAVDRIFFVDDQLWYHQTIRDKSPEANLKLAGSHLMEAEGSLQDLYLIAMGVMKLQHV